MKRIMALLIAFALLLLIDIYFYQAVLAVTKSWSPLWRQVGRIGFWIPTILSFSALIWWQVADPYTINANVRNWIITGVFATYFSKLIGIIFLLIDDLQRVVRWAAGLFQKKNEALPGEPITRSQFLTQAAVIASAVPLGAMVYGIVSGAHDYRVRKVTVKLPNLPQAFDGLRIAQLSDIHSGSFFNKTAVKGGVEMVLNEKPDLIFFTGDLVNNESVEVKDYINVFDKLKAPLVFIP
jgi:hypothetical protein